MLVNPRAFSQEEPAMNVHTTNTGFLKDPSLVSCFYEKEREEEVNYTPARSGWLVTALSHGGLCGAKH
jgi:hypothetical protein